MSLSSQKRQIIVALPFLLPAFIILAIFLVLPILTALYLSFTSYDGFTSLKWVGLRNYISHFNRLPFWISLKNTLYFVGGTVPSRMMLALALALIFNVPFKGKAVFKAIFFIPVITSLVVLSMIWLWLYAPLGGILNSFLAFIGFPPQRWLLDVNLAMPSLIVMEIWRTVGYWMVIYLAALQGIPHQLYEAARLDGANKWQLFRSITFPCLAAAHIFVLIMSTIWSFQVFTQIYIMTGGGPAQATTVLVFSIYKEAFEEIRFGYASASAMLFFLIVFAISFLNMKVLKKRTITY